MTGGNDPMTDLEAAAREATPGPWTHGPLPWEVSRPGPIQMGWATLDTARWVGRFEEAARQPVVLLRRSAILRHLGVVTSPRKGEKRVSADSGVNQALRDRFGGAAAKGTKAAPGPLYGVTGDAWSALAIAVAYSEGAA